jgi:FixJ family two-component response regulator
MTASAQPIVHVVDDADSVRRSLVTLLEEVGIPVATFPSAEAFLRTLRDDNRGCILLDVRMPGMSGLQLQQELRGRGVSMPTIILTGHADVPMAVSAMSAGAAGFVEKPFHPQELLDRIRDCIEADARQAAFQAERRQAKPRWTTPATPCACRASASTSRHARRRNVGSSKPASACRP